MKNTISLHILALCFSFVISLEEKRTDRMFSLFNVVKFTNSPCQAKSSAYLQGVCFTDTECYDRGGTEDGNCASGFGRCCVFRNSACGSTVSENCTFLENYGYPAAFDGTSPCAQTVNRMQTDICQIRLDFVNMVLGNPAAATGECDAAGDNLVIAAGATNLLGPSTPPTLCGTNTGQHVYVDAGTATAAATLTFTLAAASTATWRIKVSQIECSSEYRPPNGCLQYFMGLRNTVSSFNFGNGAGDCAPNCDLSDQDYNVCFKPEKGMCGLQYVENTAANQAPSDAFSLGAVNAGGLTTGANCGNGGLQIPVSTADFAVTNGIYCGTFLGGNAASTLAGVVKGATGSFMFRHYVNAAATPTEAVSGFSIDVSQVPC